jgi:hypothetical protein
MGFSFKMEPYLSKIKNKSDNNGKIEVFKNAFENLVISINNFKTSFENKEKFLKEEIEIQKNILKNPDMIKTKKKYSQKKFENKEIFKDILFFFMEDNNFEEFVKLKASDKERRKEIFNSLYQKFCKEIFKNDRNNLLEEQFRILTNFTFQDDEDNYNNEYKEEINYNKFYKNNNFNHNEKKVLNNRNKSGFKKEKIIKEEIEEFSEEKYDFKNDNNLCEDFKKHEENFIKENTIKDELNHVVLNELLNLDSLPISIKSDEDFPKDFNFEEFKKIKQFN